MHTYLPLIYLLPILLLLYLITVRSRRAQQAQAAVLASVRPGGRVVTTSGVHAIVTSIEDDDIVVLEIAPGVQTRWARLAIGQVIDDAATDGPGGAAATEPGSPEGDEIERDRLDTERDDRTLT